MSVKLSWNGDQVVRTAEKAVTLGIDQTMAACIIGTKGNANHPGWKNRSGFTEGSIRLLQQAVRDGAEIVGRWGSKGGVIFSSGTPLILWLEFNHGSALRTSADRNYPNLFARIRANYAAMVGGARG